MDDATSPAVGVREAPSIPAERCDFARNARNARNAHRLL